MKVLVTGGAGFIGQHLVSELIKHQYTVSIIDTQSLSTSVFDSAVTHYHADITHNIDDIFEQDKPDFVIHLAAQVDVMNSLLNPSFDAQANIIGTINVLENCRKHNVKKFIYASSAAVYGDPSYLGVDEEHPKDPLSFYGISKLSAESYIRSFSKLYGLNYTILRYANVYGPGSQNKAEGSVISIFLKRMLADKQPIIFGDGNQSRDFVFVKDVVRANLLSLHLGDKKTINISTNEPTTLNELVELINKLLEKQLHPIYRSSREGDILQSYLTNDRAQDQLGWDIQFPLEKGLHQTIHQTKYSQQ